MHPIRVTIYDQEYLIKSDEDEDQVQIIAEYVNNKLQEIQNKKEGLPEKKAIILAALDIASEYFQLMKEKNEILDNIRQRTNSIINNIDSSIE